MVYCSVGDPDPTDLHDFAGSESLIFSMDPDPHPDLNLMLLTSPTPLLLPHTLLPQPTFLTPPPSYLSSLITHPSSHTSTLLPHLSFLITYPSSLIPHPSCPFYGCKQLLFGSGSYLKRLNPDLNPDPDP